MSDIKIVELNEVSNVRDLIIGLPDTGLVGVITATYIVRYLKMKEMGYIELKNDIPIAIIHDGKPKYPIRIYQKNGLAVIFSETVIPPAMIMNLAESIFDWAEEKGIEKIYLPTGIAVPDRLDIDKPKVYAVSNDPETLKNIAGDDIKMFKEGMIVGFYGAILRRAIRSKIFCISFLAESFPNYPDPGAAVSVVEVLSKMIGFEIDVKPLLEEAEEIRIKARDLMRRTSETMRALQKAHEKELPILYYR